MDCLHVESLLSVPAARVAHILVTKPIWQDLAELAAAESRVSVPSRVRVDIPKDRLSGVGVSDGYRDAFAVEATPRGPVGTAQLGT